MADDPLQSRADTLVDSASVNAVTMFTPLLNQFPSLRGIPTKHWDFILTVAGVFVAATRLSNMRLGDAREQHLMDRVAERLTVWSPDGVRAFEDCKTLFDKNYDALTNADHDPKFIASDSVGMWIVWNTLGKTGSEEERRLVRMVGATITHTFFNWWSE